MDNCLKEYFNQNSLKFPDSSLKQVQATANGEGLDAQQCALMTDAIVANLQLKADDCVVDLCCGNGCVTQQVASRCAFVDGVDFSDVLIQNARLHHASPNITYHVAPGCSFRASPMSKTSDGSTTPTKEWLSTSNAWPKGGYTSGIGGPGVILKHFHVVPA